MNAQLWQGLVTVGASVVGWGLAMVTQNVHTSRMDRRDHYYRVLERTEDLLARCNKLAEYVYQFHQGCLKTLNGGKAVGEDSLSDFITEFQLRSASIHTTQRLFFPGIMFDTAKPNRIADELVENVRKMGSVVSRRRSGSGAPVDASEVDAVEQNARKILQRLTRELGLIENMMIVSTNKRAKKLGIKTEPVHVDRSKLPPEMSEGGS